MLALISFVMATKKRPIRRGIVNPDIPQLNPPAYYGQSFPQLKDGSHHSSVSTLDPTSVTKIAEEFLGRTGIGAGLNPQTPKDPNGSMPLTGGSYLPESFPNNVADGGSWFDMVQQGMYGNDAFTKFLESMGINYDKSMSGAAMEDWNKQLTESMLSYWLKQNERYYEEQRLKEQRNYDSPTNMLARLMGAGISRDAALQLLGAAGSAGAGAGVGVGAMSLPDGLSPSESKLNQVKSITEPINTALNVFSSVSGLVSMGFSIPQAIQQTNALKYANAMSREQLGGYNAAQKAFAVLHGIGASAESFGSIAAAIDAINGSISNPLAAQFVANGGIDELKKYPTFASDYLRKTYHSERDAQDYSKQMDQYFAQQEARTEIEQTNAAKSHLEYEQCMMALFQSEADLYRTYQAIRNGEIEIEINGVRLKRAKNDLAVDQIKTDAYLDAMNNGLDGSVSGKQMLSESIWREMFGHWRRLSIEQSPENYEKYEKFLQDNWDAACAVATIKAATTTQLSDAWNAQDNNAASVWTRFTNIFFGTKTDQIVNLLGTAAEVGSALYLGTHNKNFVQ